jgi:hypothetical protein
VCLVEDEHQLGFVDVADLGQRGEQIGQYPHQEGREHHRARGLIAQLQQRDDAVALCIEAHQIAGLQLGLAEERVSTFGFQIDQRPQDHPGRRRGDRTDRLELFLSFIAGEELDDGPQVLEVEQGKTLLVGPVEDQAQGRLLSWIEPQHL